MAFLFPQPQTPRSRIPAAPRYTDAEAGELAAEQRRKLAGDASGRRSTMGGGLDLLRGGIPNYSISSSKVLGLA